VLLFALGFGPTGTTGATGDGTPSSRTEFRRSRRAALLATERAALRCFWVFLLASGGWLRAFAGRCLHGAEGDLVYVRTEFWWPWHRRES